MHYAINLLKTKLGFQEHIQRNVVVLAVLNIILAFIALSKDILFAAFFGTTAEADALSIAYFIPDTIGNQLIGFSVTAACIPLFSRLFSEDRYMELKASIKKVLLIFLTFTAVISVLSLITRNQAVSLLGSGLPQDTKAFTASLTSIIIPTIILFSAAAVGSSALQAAGKFNITAVAPIMLNLAIMSAVIYSIVFNFGYRTGAIITAGAITAGVALVVITTWISVFKGIPRIFAEHVHPGVKFQSIAGVFKDFIPYLAILTLTQIVYCFERYIASTLGQGCIAGLNYAFRLAQFPVWVFVSAVATVILPGMSVYSGLDDREKLRSMVLKSLGTVFAITLPMSVVLNILNAPIIDILLRHGSFNGTSLNITSSILEGYSLAVVGLSVSAIILRVYLSMGKMLLPLIIFVITSTVNILLDFYMAEFIGPYAIGFGAAAGATLNAVLMLAALNSSIGLNIKKRGFFILKVITCSILIGVVAVIADRLYKL